MNKKEIFQFGEKSLYIEKNDGNIYMTGYIEDAVSAFQNGSYELVDYSPTISPAIRRAEVGAITDWVAKDADSDQSSRIGLLYGKAGIGKSVVMHDLLIALQSIDNYVVFGLKSDQVEFCDTDELAEKMHLVKPIEVVVKELAQNYKRVILLIDQIDALSLSLSSNRTPLRTLLKLIERVKQIKNVRIVISCRPYDLEYDPLLDSIKIKNKWELNDFSKEQVLQILKDNKCEDHISNNLLRFLGNPLNLYLFLKVNAYEQLTDPLSTDLLYHQLWRKYIVGDCETKVNREKLLALLDSLVTTMYDKQELSVHYRTFETAYSAEMNYLFTSGLLLMTKNGQVQFFHQTLFDYIYARRFVERGNKILDILSSQHQGLFSRAAVKSILSFLREQNSTEYIHIVTQLLYAMNENGTSKYRYHLKSLALSNMSYFENPIDGELHLIANKLFSVKAYMNVIFETVHTKGWFTAIWNVIEKNGGWKTLNKDYKDKTMQMCQRTLWGDADIVLDTVEKHLDYGDEEDCKYIENLLQHNNLNCDSQKLIKFYTKLVKSRNPLQYTNLLKNILKQNPDFVCKELTENIRLQLSEKKNKGFRVVNINSDMERLYEEMLKSYRIRAILLLADLLKMVYDKTQYQIRGMEILNSFEFFNFERTQGNHLWTNFMQGAVNIIINDLLKNADEDYAKQLIEEFSTSKHEGFVFIALYIFTSLPHKFYNSVFNIIQNRSVLSNAPCWVEYQSVEALKNSWYLFDEKQKTKILKFILCIHDTSEYKMISDEVVQRRLYFGRPILDIDIHKGKALRALPIEDIKKYSWDAYQEYLRIDRKFNICKSLRQKKYSDCLKNKIPSSSSFHSGWTSLSLEQGQKMSCDTWFNSMIKYSSNPMNWDRPSLTGQCELFRSVVSGNPDKFIQLIEKALDEDSIPLAYPQAGMQGLIDAGLYEAVDHVLRRILDKIDNNLNSTRRGFSIHSLLFALSNIIKRDSVSDTVFYLICNALLYAEEPKEDKHKDEKDIWNIGINQARGNAGYMLVECARYEKYKDKIFETIEKVALTASEYTRASILLNMAALNFLDQNRNVELFKLLMHDFNPRLMSMPVHNYNPLVYFINYAMDELIDFFTHAADCPECYKEQVIILWMAWAHNHRDKRIKPLLDRMCESSEEARVSLLNFLCTLDNRMDEDAMDYILHFMDEKFDSEVMGETCDNIFLWINAWPMNYQNRIANAFVSSPLSKHKVHSFIEYLAGYAIKDPVQTLTWLECTLNNIKTDDYFIWNHIVDVIIQSYNGIKSFNDSSYQEILEHAMDIIDDIMQNPNNKYLITNFIDKLDNE